MKKILSIIMVCFFVCFAYSCSEATENSDSITENITPVISLKSADIDMADDFSEIICTKSRMNDVLIFGKLKFGEYSGYITNSAFTEKRSFIFSPQENEKIKSATLSETGKSAVLTVLDDETFIYIFDRNGNLINTVNCGNLISESDYFADIISCDDGFYISLSYNTLVYTDINGNFSENNDITNKNIYGLFNNSEGVPCVLFEDNGKLTFANLDSNGITEQIVCDNIDSTINLVGTGTGDYQATVICKDGLYGLNGTKWLKITDFSENDFMSNSIISVIMTAENEFAITLHNETLHNNDMTYEMRLLSERDISEIKQKKIIKMANTYGGNMDIYSLSIKKFNSENEEYKIEVVDYSSDDENSGKTINNLEQDILAGNAPDIVKFNPYIPKTYFVDLYPLLDNDTDLSRSDFVEGFLGGMESNGKLLQISPTFSINTLCIKDKFADGLKEWNFEQFDSVCKNLNDNISIIIGEDLYSRVDMFMKLFNYQEFIDLKNVSCNFNSPEFIKRMQFVNDNKIGRTGPIGSFSDSAYQNMYDFRHDGYLLINATINSYRDFKIYEQVYGGESCTFIGCPSDSGNGLYCSLPTGYSIMADSQNIEGAWKFLKYYLFEDENQSNDLGYMGFPCLEKKLSEQLEYNKTLHTNENPETGEQQNIELYAMYEPNSSEPTVIELEPLSSEKATEYDNLVHNAVKNSGYMNGEIYNILTDEMPYYFEGERSAEETADIIQNRVSIYISEKYQ